MIDAICVGRAVQVFKLFGGTLSITRASNPAAGLLWALMFVQQCALGYEWGSYPSSISRSLIAEAFLLILCLADLE